MRFFSTASALLALVASAVAQTPGFNPIHTPLKNEEINAGSTYEITWTAPAEYADGTVAISLIGGASPALLMPVKDIASGIPNSAEKYSWAIDASLGTEATYGIVITYESNSDVYQYSQPFSIVPQVNAGDDEDTTTVSTVTTSFGTKTVQLTSAEPTTTSESEPETTSESSSVHVETTTTAVWTTTTKAVDTSVVVVTSHTTPATGTDSEPTNEVPPPATTTDPVTGAASRFSAVGAVVGGLIVAVLAM